MRFDDNTPSKCPGRTRPPYMRRLKLLTHRRRLVASNRALGLLLAFNAGAVNAGGFLVLHMYTSHMTGFTSQLADGLVLGNATLWLNALGAILAFVLGAAVCAIATVETSAVATASARMCNFFMMFSPYRPAPGLRGANSVRST